jgi:type II secretory pathway pseudopilin PulG
MRMKKFQNIASIIIIILIALLIVIKWFQNRSKKTMVWTDEDRTILIDNCIETIGARAVRFPLITEEYCECSTDTLMKHFSKYEYLEIEQKEFKEKMKIFTPVILECHNHYQEQSFLQSRLD